MKYIKMCYGLQYFQNEFVNGMPHNSKNVFELGFCNFYITLD